MEKGFCGWSCCWDGDEARVGGARRADHRHAERLSDWHLPIRPEEKAQDHFPQLRRDAVPVSNPNFAQKDHTDVGANPGVEQKVPGR